MLSYEHGMNYDLFRRGFDLKDNEDWDDIRKLHYSQEEYRAQKKMLEKQFGKNITGL